MLMSSKASYKSRFDLSRQKALAKDWNKENPTETERDMKNQNGRSFLVSSFEEMIKVKNVAVIAFILSRANISEFN